MPTFDNLGLQEPSTITAVIGTVQIMRGSTLEHQEILVLGDPDSSNGLASVLNTAPASTAWGLSVRQVGFVAPSTIVTVSTGSVRVHQSTASDLQVTAAQGGTWNVGTVTTVTTVATVTTVSSVAGVVTVTPTAGSTWAVRPLQSSAADLQMTATPFAGSTWATRPIQSSAADLQVTSTPAVGSTWRTQPGSTAWASSAGFHFDSSGALLQGGYVSNNAGVAVETSTKAVNSTAVGLFVRSAGVDSTFAAGQAGSSGDVTVLSSAAGVSIFVYAFCVAYPPQSSAAAGGTAPVTVRWLTNSTNQAFRVVFAAPSTSYMTDPVVMAVTPPMYLFKTPVAGSVQLNATSSGVNYSIYGWKE